MTTRTYVRSSVEGCLAMVVLAGAVSCSGDTLDVGSDGSGSGGGSGGSGGSTTAPSPTAQQTPGVPLPDWETLRACAAGNPDSPFVGSWEGAAEDFDFDVKLRIRLVIESASADGVCGHLIWGDETAAPPPATDPTADYPPGAPVDYDLRYGRPVFEGFRYSVLGGGARDRTLRFHTPRHEPFVGYCELQSPLYEQSRGRWQCLPEAAQGLVMMNSTQECKIFTNSTTITTSITQCVACLDGMCACNESGCTADATASQDFDFTLEDSEEGDVLTGPGIDYPYPNLTLRLVRVE
jgi:hypothetical protein